MEKFSTPHVVESNADPNPAFDRMGGTITMRCSRCGLRTQCFGREMPEDLLRQFELHIQARQIPRGAPVYRDGAVFNALYFIREGAFKNLVSNAQGDAFIIGFALQGDVLGLDGYADGYHVSHPVALQDSEICEFPTQELQALCLEHPSLRNVLQSLIGRALARAQQERVFLGRLSAEERLWSFLQDVACKLSAPDVGTKPFELPMTREDIADFLGLKMETVSRALHKLQDAGLLNVRRRHIRLTRKPDSY